MGQVGSLRSRTENAAEQVTRLTVARDAALARADEATRAFQALETNVAGLDEGELGLDSEYEGAEAGVTEATEALAALKEQERDASQQRAALAARVDALQARPGTRRCVEPAARCLRLRPRAAWFGRGAGHRRGRVRSGGLRSSRVSGRRGRRHGPGRRPGGVRPPQGRGPRPRGDAARRRQGHRREVAGPARRCEVRHRCRDRRTSPSTVLCGGCSARWRSSTTSAPREVSSTSWPTSPR